MTHVAKDTTVWHMFTKAKADKCYGIITKHVDGKLVTTIKDVYATRKEAKQMTAVKFKQLTTHS